MKEVSRNGLLTAGVALLIAAGAVLVRRRESTGKPETSPQPASLAVSEAAEVNLSGRVQARTVVMVGAPIEGVLDSFFVDLGQEVYQGQLLGRIRNGQLEMAVQQAQAELDQAQRRVTAFGNDAIAARLETSRASAGLSRARTEVESLEKIYQRQQSLWRDGVTPRLTFEKAEKDYTGAKAEWDRLEGLAKQAEEREAMLARDQDAARRAVSEQTEAVENARAKMTEGDLHSPVDGVVVGRRGGAGQPVDVSMNDLLQIATDLTSLQIILTPEPAVLARIHAGQQAFVRAGELGAEELAGVVREIRGVEVIVDFTSPTPVVKPGLTAQVRIKL